MLKRSISNSCLRYRLQSVQSFSCAFRLQIEAMIESCNCVNASGEKLQFLCDIRHHVIVEKAESFLHRTQYFNQRTLAVIESFQCKVYRGIWRIDSRLVSPRRGYLCWRTSMSGLLHITSQFHSRSISFTFISAHDSILSGSFSLRHIDRSA